MNKIVEQDKLSLKEEKDVSESSQVETIVSADAIQPIALSETKPSSLVACTSRVSRSNCDFEHSGLNIRPSRTKVWITLLGSNHAQTFSGRLIEKEKWRIE